MILIDQSMPIMDGIEATRRIRKFVEVNELIQPYIIACTGHTEEIYIRQAWNNGIDEIIPKPARIDRIQ